MWGVSVTLGFPRPANLGIRSSGALDVSCEVIRETPSQIDEVAHQVEVSVETVSELPIFLAPVTDGCVYAAAVQPTADGSCSASLAAPPAALHSADYDTAPPQKCQKIGNHVQRLLEKSVFHEDACQEFYQRIGGETIFDGGGGGGSEDTALSSMSLVVYSQSLQQAQVLEGSSLHNTDLIVLQMTTGT
ncbi:hypothetical protein EYF80_039479 [Liparis tanakae]|uniref:Uncharacterized protein n=1 Tax=Liparis tanakae TaxID=230148 RepID=A0A4Z2GBN4_9TELE|nr:hypothetical protein EYF80_039479 [Liparis tanakae]